MYWKCNHAVKVRPLKWVLYRAFFVLHLSLYLNQFNFVVKYAYRSFYCSQCHAKYLAPTSLLTIHTLLKIFSRNNKKGVDCLLENYFIHCTKWHQVLMNWCSYFEINASHIYMNCSHYLNEYSPFFLGQIILQLSISIFLAVGYQSLNIFKNSSAADNENEHIHGYIRWSF